MHCIISGMLTVLSLDHEFWKTSGVIHFSRVFQVRTLSDDYFRCCEDVQAADYVTSDHVTVDVAERYM